MFKRIANSTSVIRLADGAVIPASSDNRDFREFLDWQAAGNTPDIADPAPSPPDMSDLDNVEKQIKALALVIAQYTGKSPATVKADFRAAYRSLP